MAMSMVVMRGAYSEIEQRGSWNAAGQGADGGAQRDRLFHDLEGRHGRRAVRVLL